MWNPFKQNKDEIKASLLQVIWEPQEDITSHELAITMRVLLAKGEGVLDAFCKASENVRRHFYVHNWRNGQRVSWSELKQYREKTEGTE